MHFHGRSVRRHLSVEHLETRHMLAAPMPGVATGSPSELPVVAGWLTPSSAQWRGAGSSQVDFAHETLGLTGQGQTVAVIDTGIAYDHIALGGGFGGSHRVVGGWDFAESDPDPYDDAPAGFHGTHVAGIIGSDHEVYTGVAPGVDLVALRVFDDRGAGTLASVEAALEWVHQHRDEFAHPITTVNLSVSSAWNADFVPAWGRLEDEFAQLQRDGIFIAVAAGNSFADYHTPGLAYPAVSPHVVPVASLSASGQLSAFSQRHERVLLAPGESVTSTVPAYLYDFNGITDDFFSASGTSMAAPFAAGASVLLREAFQLVGDDNLGQQALLEHLQRTADLVFDSVSGAHYQSINLERALRAALPADDFFDHPQSAHDLGMLGNTLELAGMINALDDQDFFRFTATQSGTVRLEIDVAGNLQPAWDLPGGNGLAPGGHPEFKVTAGQSYVIGLGTAAGIGTYSVQLSLDVAAAELGVVDAVKIDLSAAHRSYTWTAAHTGWLTVSSSPTSVTGPYELELVDATGQELARVDANGGPARMQIDAVAGQRYALRIAGGPVSGEISLTNLVSVDGEQIRLFATAGNDRFVVRQLADSAQVAVHGDTYDLGPQHVLEIQIVDGNQADEILVFGSPQNESADLYVGYARLTGPTTQMLVSGLGRMAISGGGGEDELTFHGTEGDDRFVATPDYAILSAAGGVRHVGRDFASVRVLATPGQDEAIFYDSASHDRLRLAADSAELLYPTATIHVDGFASLFALANNGGRDTVEIVDSPFNDRVVFRPEMVVFETPFANQYAKGFETISVSSAQGGDDTLIAFDSYGNDRLHVSPQVLELRTTNATLQATGFQTSAVLASRGGFDIAEFADSPGNDIFVSDGNLAMLTGNDLRHVARGFQEFTAVSVGGGFDTARLYASVTGLDVVHRTASGTSLLGAESATHLQGFGEVVVIGQALAGPGDGDGGGQGGAGPETSVTFAATQTGWSQPAGAAGWSTPQSATRDQQTSGRREMAAGNLPPTQSFDNALQKLVAVDNYYRQIRSRHRGEGRNACTERILIDPAAEFQSIDALFGRSELG